MSIVRTVLASAVAAATLLAVAEPAHAYQAIKGNLAVGPSYSKSVSKGDFGAGFQIKGQAYAHDFDQLCATTTPAYQCSNETGFGKMICQSIYGAINPQLCAQHGLGFGAGGNAAADVTLFGKDVEMFNIGAGASVEPTIASAGWHINLLGAKVAGQDKSTGFSGKYPLGERTIFSASSTFMLGPIPVKVEASAVGSVGIEYGLQLGSANVVGNAGPYVEVDGVFSAGLGTKGLSAGIEGELLLVKLSTPATASIGYTGGKSFTYAAGQDFVINSLDGSISLYAEAGPYKKSWEIFSWSGLQYTKNIASTSGSFSL